jgi:hypothetical protein
MADTGKYGIKDSAEIIKAMAESSVILYAGVKAMKKLPDTATASEKAVALGQAVAAQVMLDPNAVQIFKDAFDGAGNAIKECQDLGLLEGTQLALVAGQAMVSAATRVQAMV